MLDEWPKEFCKDLEERRMYRLGRGAGVLFVTVDALYYIVWRTDLH